jgi:hypothetical protein
MSADERIICALKFGTIAWMGIIITSATRLGVALGEKDLTMDI